MKISEVNKQRIELYGGIFIVLLIISIATNLYRANVIVKRGIALTPTRSVEALVHPERFDESILSAYTREKSFSSTEVTDWLRDGKTVLVGTEPQSGELLLIYGANNTEFLAIDESGADTALTDRYRIYYVEN